jgi:hypothetical protein
MLSFLFSASSVLIFVPNVQAVQIVQDVGLDPIPEVRERV